MHGLKRKENRSAGMPGDAPGDHMHKWQTNKGCCTWDGVRTFLGRDDVNLGHGCSACFAAPASAASPSSYICVHVCKHMLKHLHAMVYRQGQMENQINKIMVYRVLMQWRCMRGATYLEDGGCMRLACWRGRMPPG